MKNISRKKNLFAEFWRKTMDENENIKFLYEKAIEGREHHQQNYNHWMNMYAIFNGAIFIGFYSLQGKVDVYFIKLLLLFIGFVAGCFWHFSVRGFYRWILSWIGVVSFYEHKLAQEMGVYRIFIHFDKEKRFLYSPFSTQKLTRLFSLLIAIAWGVLIVFQIVFSWEEIKNTEKFFSIFLLTSIIIVLVAAGVKICRENLKNSHFHYIKDGHSEFKKFE